MNPKIKTQLDNIKYRGSTARIHFALKDLPNIKGIKEDKLNTVFSITPSIYYLEKSFDEVKYGRFSKSKNSSRCLRSFYESDEYSS